MARFYLHETVSWQRWLGVVLITVGVGFVAQGPSLTVHPAPARVRDSAIEVEQPQ
jgi:drug/metabolite transporter (DMT)-like permease